MTPQRTLRMQRVAARLCAHHPRVLCELLVEIERVEHIDVLSRAERFASLDPEILRAVGGDRFPVRVRGVS